MAPAEHLFRRALEAAHKALQDLTRDQVPAELRRVVRTPLPLPPPLAAALLKALDEYPWLREKALEAWPEADSATAGPERASALVLQRPSGWVARLAAAASELARREGREALAAQKEQAKSLREKLAAAKGKARADRQKAEGEAAQLREALARERAARPSSEEGEAGREAAREVERLAVQLAAATAAADRSRRDLRKAQDKAAAERRLRAAAEARLAERLHSGSWQGDARGLAEILDQTAQMARPPAKTARIERKSAGEAPLRLPAPLRPDRKESIGWLVAQPGPGVVIVDGYNLGFQLAGRRDPAGGRARAVMAADHLRRGARGPWRIIVVFDSALGAVDELLPGPVEIRYTAEAGGADREIAELARSLEGARVVISNDREVREAAERCGALALWSDAVAEWEGSR